MPHLCPCVGRKSPWAQDSRMGKRASCLVALLALGSLNTAVLEDLHILPVEGGRLQ